MAMILAAVLAACYFVVLALCIHEFRERKMPERGKAVYLSKANFWVGAVCTLLFLAPSFLSAAQEASVWTSLVFEGFSALCMILMLGWKNCYILYDHNGFTQRNFFGVERSYSYRELTAFRFSGNVQSIKLYAGRKTVSMDQTSVDGIDFLKEARKGYARFHNGKQLPNRWAEARKAEKTTGRGSFSAHVHNPGEFLAAFILVMVFVLGVGIAIVVMMLQPVDPADCQKMTVTFSGWSMDEDRMILNSEEHPEAFRINGCEKFVHDPEGLQSRCDGSTQFEVWVVRVTPEEAEDYYRIEAISADGVEFRTFEDSTNYEREGLPQIFGLFGGIILFMLLIFWLTYRIGCNPRKYPKWLVDGFFKPGTISY